MKKSYLILLSALLGLQAGAVDKQAYAEQPEYFPAAFAWEMTRTDYRGTDDAGQPQLVNTQQVLVEWEPN